MDPSLFRIDFERLTEVLVSLVIFSFFIERALSVIFETKLFIDFAKGDEQRPKKKGIREMIALIVSVGFCFAWDFDAITIVLQSSDKMSVGGTIITGAIIAGGSKVSIGIFKDMLGFMSLSEKERRDKQNPEQ